MRAWELTEIDYPLAGMDEWYGNRQYKEQGGKMVYMSPDEYISKVKSLELDDISLDNIDDLVNHMKSGRKLDPLVIYPDGKEDGRHRAYAAKKLGIKSVPVIIWENDELIESEACGDCFAVAGRSILDDNTDSMILVHGMVTGQGKLEGKRFEHAWVEIGDVVLDNANGNNVVMRKEQYYKLGNIDPNELQRYNKDEALKNMVRYKHWGPWE